MRTIKHEEVVVFCPGCPSQNNYVGEVVDGAARVEIGDPVVSFQFIDEEQGESERIIFHRDWTQATARLNKEALAGIFVEDTIERIGKCATVGVNVDGTRYCPAFNSGALSRLFRHIQNSVKI